MLYTYLFSCFPIVYFWSKNQYLLPLHYLLGICSINICLVFLLNTLFKKSKHFLLLELLFSLSCLFLYYFVPVGRFIYYNLIQKYFSFIYPYLRTYKIGLSTLLCFGFMFFIFLIKKRIKPNNINKNLNIFCICFCSIFFIGLFFNNDKFLNFTKTKETSIKHPNVYHILLDAYTNEFTLKNTFHYDNSAFYRFLQKNNFEVFHISYSSYNATVASVSHMLNFGKLILDNQEVYGLKNPTLKSSVVTKNNKVFPLLREKGYHLYGFCNTVPSLYETIQHNTNNSNISTFFMGLFYDTLIENVAMHIFGKSFYKNQINLIIQTFDDLKNAASTYGFSNNYFYAHVLCPHQPFLFDDQGNQKQNPSFDGMFATKLSDYKNRKIFIRNYINNVKKITQLTVDTITYILSQYDKDNQPIIILHGDHGYVSYVESIQEIKTAIANSNLTPNMHGYLGNLFAIYMPESWKKDTKDLTFNNLYRFIFNHLFNTNYKYLPPRHFINNVEVPHELLVKRPAE